MKQNNQTRYLGFSIIGLCCIALIAACGTTATQANSDTQLQVTRASQLTATHYPSFTRTITDPDQVKQVFNAIQALPAAKPFSKDHITFCGDQVTPLEYQLTFVLPHISEQHAILFPTPGDCRTVSLNGVLHNAPDNAFWLKIAHILGVSEDELVHPQQLK